MAAADPADTLAPTARPSVRTSAQEMERALTALSTRERRHELYKDLLSAADVAGSPRSGWLLLRVGEHPDSTRADLARQLHVTDANLTGRLGELVDLGYLRRLPDDLGKPVALSPAGRIACDNLFGARQQRIARLLSDWHPEQHPELLALINRITHELAASGERPGSDLEPSTVH